MPLKITALKLKPEKFSDFLDQMAQVNQLLLK